MSKGSLLHFTHSCGSRGADEGQAGAGGGSSLTLPAKDGRWRQGAGKGPRVVAGRVAVQEVSWRHHEVKHHANRSSLDHLALRGARRSGLCGRTTARSRDRSDPAPGVSGALRSPSAGRQRELIKGTATFEWTFWDQYRRGIDPCLRRSSDSAIVIGMG